MDSLGLRKLLSGDIFKGQEGGEGARKGVLGLATGSEEF